jgi:hypothetical protein
VNRFAESDDEAKAVSRFQRLLAGAPRNIIAALWNFMPLFDAPNCRGSNAVAFNSVQRVSAWNVLRHPGIIVGNSPKSQEHPMAQTQSQKRGGQLGSGINNPNQQGDEADRRRQQGGGTELPKQQNQDPSRRGGAPNALFLLWAAICRLGHQSHGLPVQLTWSSCGGCA